MGGVFGILPLIFALVVVHTAEGLGPTPPLFGLTAIPSLVVGMAGSALLWFVVVTVTARLAARGRNPLAAMWWDNLATAGALTLFAWWCYHLHWPWLIPGSSLLQLLPFCLILAAAWWSGGRAFSPDRSRRLAWQATAIRLKFGVLPALVALSLFDLVSWLVIDPLLADGGPTALGRWAEPALLLVSVAMILAVVVFMPAVVVRLWGATTMPPGPHRELIEDGCRRMGVSVARILRWPAAAGRFYNAAAMGLVPQLRYVLFSDDLLDELTPDQLRAVLGHELGHIRHRHIWIYLGFLLASSMVAWGMAPFLLSLMVGMPGAGGLPANLLHGVAVLILFAFLLRGVFGVLSRACERQADLAGVELAGGTAPMRQALLRIAELAGQPLDAPSWRHHSIRERVAYLAAVEDDPRAPQRHHGHLRRLVLAIAGVLILFLALGTLRPGAIDEASWLEDHPAAATALEDAEAGAWRSLSAWMAQADADTHRELARLIDGRIQRTFADHQRMVTAGTATTSEAAVLYDLRGLLYPLVYHPTGDPAFDAYLANNAAYAAVAGSADPSEEDLEVARAALPVVNRAAFEADQPAYHDTVGCILLRLGDRDRARRHFEMALEDVPEGDEAFRELLRRRIEAAEDPQATLPLEPPPTAEPSEI